MGHYTSEGAPTLCENSRGSGECQTAFPFFPTLVSVPRSDGPKKTPHLQKISPSYQRLTHWCQNTAWVESSPLVEKQWSGWLGVGSWFLGICTLTNYFSAIPVVKYPQTTSPFRTGKSKTIPNIEDQWPREWVVPTTVKASLAYLCGCSPNRKIVLLPLFLSCLFWTAN